jgi:hypothetical protein
MKPLEQMLEKVYSRKYRTIDLYAAGTLALYSGPDMSFSVPLAYNDRAPSPFDRQTTLYDYGALPPMKLPEFRPPEISKIEINEFNKTCYAKDCEDYGFGTIENINVNPRTQERIKIYTDVFNNKIGVGYEPFDRKHIDKDFLDFDRTY